MLDNNDRVIVEAIRNAPRIKIIIDGGGNSEDTEIAFSPSKILSHDIALAVQSHYNRINNNKQ